MRAWSRGGRRFAIWLSIPQPPTHLCTKLARDFMADTPPPSLVERLAKVFLDTGGDLKEVAKAMVSSDGILGRCRRPS